MLQFVVKCSIPMKPIMINGISDFLTYFCILISNYLGVQTDAERRINTRAEYTQTWDILPPALITANKSTFKSEQLASQIRKVCLNTCFPSVSVSLSLSFKTSLYSRYFFSIILFLFYIFYY